MTIRTLIRSIASAVCLWACSGQRAAAQAEASVPPSETEMKTAVEAYFGDLFQRLEKAAAQSPTEENFRAIMNPQIDQVDGLFGDAHQRGLGNPPSLLQARLPGGRLQPEEGQRTGCFPRPDGATPRAPTQRAGPRKHHAAAADRPALSGGQRRQDGRHGLDDDPDREFSENSRAGQMQGIQNHLSWQRSRALRNAFRKAQRDKSPVPIDRMGDPVRMTSPAYGGRFLAARPQTNCFSSASACSSVPMVMRRNSPVTGPGK